MSDYAAEVAVQKICLNKGNGSKTADPHLAHKGPITANSGHSRYSCELLKAA
jgi:hypothetical protein